MLVADQQLMKVGKQWLKYRRWKFYCEKSGIDAAVVQIMQVYH